MPAQDHKSADDLHQQVLYIDDLHARTFLEN